MHALKKGVGTGLRVHSEGNTVNWEYKNVVDVLKGFEDESGPVPVEELRRWDISRVRKSNQSGSLNWKAVDRSDAGVTLGSLAQLNLAGNSYANDIWGTCGVFGHHSKTCYYSRNAAYCQHCDRDGHFYSACRGLGFDQGDKKTGRLGHAVGGVKLKWALSKFGDLDDERNSSQASGARGSGS